MALLASPASVAPHWAVGLLEAAKGKSVKGKTYLSTNKQKPVHPKSRKAVALTKQFKKDLKTDKLRGHKNMKLQLQGVKLAYFRENFDSSLEKCTPQYLDELIERYINRNAEELEQIKQKSGVLGNTKQHAVRKDAIQFAMKTERQEYDSTGFEMANLFDKETFLRFKEWEGDLRFISSMKLKTFLKSQLVKPLTDVKQ